MNPEIETRVEALLRQLTLREKCALVSGKDDWRTVPIPRLGINSLTMTDGPHGVRATHGSGRVYAPSTSFPTGISLASTWDTDLVEQVGEALGDETLALGCNVLLGPCVNIIRHPTAGRNFESYSEDPYLAGRIGTAWVKGLQSKGVGASLKHYACNNQEDDRMRGSSEIDERTLREIYLAQFEMVVKEANPWTVMCSYNRINGTYASQNDHLLNQILKKEWGFEGVVVSDWGANHTIFSSIQGGLDLEMPGPAKYYGQLLVEAVENWQIDIKDVDEAVRRVLRLLIKSGVQDLLEAPAGELNSPRHQALARQVAEESITLLKNESNVLPLDLSKIKTLAVIGPMATQAAIGGGGSSFLQPPYVTPVLDALKARLGAKPRIVYAQGCDNFADIPIMNPELIKPKHGNDFGLLGQYYPNPTFSGKPAFERVDSRLDWWRLSFAPLETTPSAFSVRWTGTLLPTETGRHIIQTHNTGHLRIFLNEKLILENTHIPTAASFPAPSPVEEMELTKGKKYDFKIEYTSPSEVDFPNLRVLFTYAPLPDQDHRFILAIDVAKKADAALVFVGWPEGHESEGHDRPGIALTGRQDDLVSAVSLVNPNTIVILNCGSPVAMPWRDQVKGIVEAYYPGMEGGNAITNILLGTANPSGKLAVTFPKRIQDCPAYTNFGPGRSVRYGEGVYVGYRHYDHMDIEPLFPFGHGLSYTTFEYSDLQVQTSGKIKDPVSLSIVVKNTGKMAGKEVVQVYVSDLAASLPRPPKELKEFAKVTLQPGEQKILTFQLPERAFSFYNPIQQDWTVEPGKFHILVGASSSDIRLRELIELR
jgi:beta-glucosidase